MPSTDEEEERRGEQAGTKAESSQGEEDPGGKGGSGRASQERQTVAAAFSGEFFWCAFPSTLLPGYTSIYTNGDSPAEIPALVLDPVEAVGLAPARVLAGVGAGERLRLVEASGGAAEEFRKLLLLDGPGEEPGHLQICTGSSFSPADVFLAPEFGIVSQRRRATLGW